MKQILSILFLILTLSTFGQNNPDFENLVKIGEIYSMNVNGSGDEFNKSLEALRRPGLDHIIDALIAVGNRNIKLLTKEFLTKPSEQELKYWYVIREIHYNNHAENSDPKSSDVVAKETLDKNIDSRWLLDNYYYRIRSGIATIFNEKDLSKFDIDLNNYKLENDTEKAILYFAIIDALAQRFKVLQMMNNYDQILEFSGRLPTFNRKPYYEFTAFDFEDFEWIGYDKIESYKEINLRNQYSTLNGHFSALAEKEKTEEMRNLYFNSIFFIPEYFKYSGEMENDLRALYNESKK